MNLPKLFEPYTQGMEALHLLGLLLGVSFLAWGVTTITGRNVSPRPTVTGYAMLVVGIVVSVVSPLAQLVVDLMKRIPQTVQAPESVHPQYVLDAQILMIFSVVLWMACAACLGMAVAMMVHTNLYRTDVWQWVMWACVFMASAAILLLVALRDTRLAMTGLHTYDNYISPVAPGWEVRWLIPTAIFTLACGAVFAMYMRGRRHPR